MMLPNFDLNSQLKCLIERMRGPGNNDGHSRTMRSSIGITGGFDVHCAKCSGKRLKDIQRNLRRLQECDGRHRQATDLSRCANSLISFSNLRRLVWKGDYNAMFCLRKSTNYSPVTPSAAIATGKPAASSTVCFSMASRSH